MSHDSAPRCECGDLQRVHVSGQGQCFRGAATESPCACKKYRPRRGKGGLEVVAEAPKAADMLHCSFCGKGQEAIRKLVQGPGVVAICDECIALCAEIVADLPLFEEEPTETEPQSDSDTSFKT